GPGQAMPSLDGLMSQMQQQFTHWQSQMSGLFGTTNGAVNWSYAKDTARKTAAELGPDPTPDEQTRHDIREASMLADQWLDAVITFPSVGSDAVAWSRAEWIEATMPTWSKLVDPVVTHLADALGGVVTQGVGNELPGFGGDFFTPMIRQAASVMFGGQMGQALGGLAAVTTSTTDIGLPLASRPALIPRNMRAFGEGLDDITERDLRMFLTLRELARQRLFSSVAWLAPQLLAYVEHYAREITIDSSALEDAVGSIEELNAEGLQELSLTINGKLFDPAKTPEQREILERLETLLALVEGWVDQVVSQAGTDWLPNIAALTELVRRRRAAGGPGESALHTLVGLELRPRRIRDAANLWAAIDNERGAEGRDDVWRHPDLLPTGKDLDDPLGYVAVQDAPALDDFDRELQQLLESETGGDTD
ncbi:MAG: zinc-dependent metalloprotease, partial [Propionibacteriaceae bacterium]